MTYSYSGSPSDSDLDTVRYLIGDTDETGHILEDEEIQYEIDNEGSVIDAAINAINGIIAEIAQNPDAVDAEEVSADYQEQVNRYISVRKQLKKRKNSQGKNLQNVGTGDTLFKDKDAEFSIGIHDNNEIF